MLSHLVINDTQASIGEPRFSVNNPKPDPIDLISQLIASQTELLGYVSRLEARIASLEARTWWSMLRDQMRSWFTRIE